MDEPSRRTVLAASAAAVAAVAGCSTYGEPQDTTPGTSAPVGTALAKTTDVPVGGGLIVGGSQVVITQPAAGTFKAFTSVCTHQQCQVANVDGGTINCTCHGSKFAIADGSVVSPPATQPLAPRQIKVAGDSIQLA